MARTLLITLLATVLAGTAAAQRASIGQLEQLLAAHSVGSGDAIGSDLMAEVKREDDLVQRLSALELSERLTPPTRSRLARLYKLGPLTLDTLQLLADRSALLDPPRAEIPTLPPPDRAAQHAMIRAAQAFVFQTLAHLPNFFAQRTTAHFDNAPIRINGLVISESPHLHMAGTIRREITFSDGREISTPMQKDAENTQESDFGMQTQGEFGPEPAIVFLDLAHGAMAFDHWEATPDGTVAVFGYSVPTEASHYEVSTSCRSGVLKRRPAYRGSLAIAPTTGALLRLTLQAESNYDDPLSQIASVIEYGPVVLGNKTYICPQRSLAFSVQQRNACDPHHRKLARPVAFINRTVFAGYHRLGSESTIVPHPAFQPSSQPDLNLSPQAAPPIN